MCLKQRYIFQIYAEKITNIIGILLKHYHSLNILVTHLEMILSYQLVTRRSTYGKTYLYLFHLLYHIVFDIDILEYSFYHHVSLTKAIIFKSGSKATMELLFFKTAIIILFSKFGNLILIKHIKSTMT